MKRILVIEDDAHLLIGLRDNLEAEGYEVGTASDGQTGVLEATSRPPDAIILDLMLPRLSGFDVCRVLKQRGFNTPILILTARVQETDKVLGLELGADDYVTKPFSIHELVARLRAVLRRASPVGQAERYQFEDIELNFRQQRIRKAGRELPLSNLEFEVLRYLVVRRGEIVSRDQLLNDVWGYRSFPTTRSVDNLVARIRHKLESDPRRPRHILTIHGTGYKFVD